MTSRRRSSSKVVDCPSCAGFKSETRGRIATFTVNGIRHYAPNIWLGVRSERLQREGDQPMSSWYRAMLSYTEQCELAARFDAERARAAA